MGLDFEKANGTHTQRMTASLNAGQQAGGDKRVKRSTILLVVRKNGGIPLRSNNSPLPMFSVRVSISHQPDCFGC